MRHTANIILMTVDSLRADHVGCYQATPTVSLTPNIDRLAARSHVFSRAFAQGPYTTLSMPSLFTGKYPCRLKRMSRGIAMEHPTGVLVEGTTILPEILRDAGYHTAAFHSNPLLSRLFGFDKGFDSFYDDVLLSGSGLSESLKLMVARAHRIFRVDPYLCARLLHEQVAKWLKTAPQPFFLWIHYMDAHGPYLARKVLKYVSRGERLWRKGVFSPDRVMREEREVLAKNYKRQVSSLDEELGRFWRLLAERISLDDALLILTADHGDEFFEHGGFGHLHKLYDELLHVPLIISLPGVSGRRVDDLVQLIQIAPTILEFTAVDRKERKDFDGDSLLPGLRDAKRHASKGFVVSEAGTTGHEKICIRTAEWKLIRNRDGNTKELYHLTQDPGEKRNVGDEHPHEVADLEVQMLAHSAAPAPSASARVAVSSAAPQISDAEQSLVEERLRDLGYI